MSIDALKEEIDRRADSFTRSGAADWRVLEEAETRDIEFDDRPLAVLGAGSVWPQAFIRHLAERRNVVAFVDNARIGDTRFGRPFIGDEGLRDAARRHAGLVAVMCCASDGAVAHFAALCARIGLPVLSLFQAMRRENRLSFGLAHGEVDGIVSLCHDNPFLGKFADGLSQEIYYRLLLHRLSWSRHWLDPIRRPFGDIYFTSGAFELTDREVLVDGGAYDGDTVRAFDRWTGGKARHIHAFEPDDGSAEALRRNFPDRANLTVVEAGLWSESTTLAFNAEGTHGSSLGCGSAEVRVVALDDCGIDDVTLLKLDVEGAEIPALHGARQTIRRARPRLAICAYHLKDDLLTIPAAILDTRPDYRLYLRHYSPWLTDSVIYAA